MKSLQSLLQKYKNGSEYDIISELFKNYKNYDLCDPKMDASGFLKKLLYLIYDSGCKRTKKGDTGLDEKKVNDENFNMWGDLEMILEVTDTDTDTDKRESRFEVLFGDDYYHIGGDETDTMLYLLATEWKNIKNTEKKQLKEKMVDVLKAIEEKELTKQNEKKIKELSEDKLDWCKAMEKINSIIGKIKEELKNEEFKIGKEDSKIIKETKKMLNDIKNKIEKIVDDYYTKNTKSNEANISFSKKKTFISKLTEEINEHISKLNSRE